MRGGGGANPARKKEVEDSSKRIAGLLWKLNRADVSASVCGKLLQLCASLDAGDVVAQPQAQVALTTSDWDEGSRPAWLDRAQAAAQAPIDARMSRVRENSLENLWNTNGRIVVPRLSRSRR